MLSNVMSVFSFNEIEYFTYVNLLIVSLMLFYLMLFMVIHASSLILNSVFYNDVLVEVLMTLVSFLYIIWIISPALLLFLAYDFISSLTNFNVFVLGYQWAWNYNVMFNNLSYTFDQLVLPSSAFSYSFFGFIDAGFTLSTMCGLGSAIALGLECLIGLNVSSLMGSLLHNLSNSPVLRAACVLLLPTDAVILGSSASPFSSFYLCLFSNYLLLPLHATISLYVFSFDVIHSFGYHCFGFKSDAIPGRVNHVSSLQLHFSGHFISYCYELCGLAHTSMLSSVVVL